jgi:hypothetical protein
VTVRFSRSPAGFRRAAMLAIAALLVPLPLVAADQMTAAQASAQPLRASIAKHAAREVSAASLTPRAPKDVTQVRSQQQRSSADNRSFFRSPAGIACLAVIAAGTGYAIYSSSHDRIHSVARDGQK